MQRIPADCSAAELKNIVLNGDIPLEELCSADLNRLIDNELMLICLECSDTEFIDKCAAVLNSREDDSGYREAFERGIENGRALVKINEDAAKPLRKKAPSIKRILILAATMITLAAMALTLSSADYGIDIDEYLLEVVKSGPGTRIIVENMEFYCPKWSKKYKSYDELFGNEDLDILYPTTFPGGYKVDWILMMDSGRDSIDISVITTEHDPHHCFSVEIDTPNELEITVCDKTYEKHGMTFYFFYEKNDVSFAVAQKGSHYYCISSYSFEDIIYIIDNLRSSKE